jgi:hypothetical protein
MPRVYPQNWDELAAAVKADAGGKCERCGHPNEVVTGYVLTVAHLDHRLGDERWNLAALCQRCHLKYEHRIDFRQRYFLPLMSPWFVPHYRGYLLWRLEAARQQLLSWARDAEEKLKEVANGPTAVWEVRSPLPGEILKGGRA